MTKKKKTLTAREAFLLFEAAVYGDATLFDDPDVRALKRLVRLKYIDDSDDSLTPEGRKAVKRMRGAV
jgi:hypothetical protein